MKQAIICDLDGTLCDVEHRRHFTAEKNWPAFYANLEFDKPRVFVMRMLEVLRDEYDIFFVSGRPEEYRGKTIEWLDKYGIYTYVGLYMRPNRDNRPDTEIKKEILNTHLKGRKIVLAIDDRPSVIRMWRNEGIDVLDVGAGKEF